MGDSISVEDLQKGCPRISRSWPVRKEKCALGNTCGKTQAARRTWYIQEIGNISEWLEYKVGDEWRWVITGGGGVTNDEVN